MRPATIGGALVFEHVFGYVPCKLCLMQRNPYYLAILGALAAAALPALDWGGPRLLALIFIVSAGLGAYHAGVEWGFCRAERLRRHPRRRPGGMGDFLNQLQTTRVVNCTEAAWRFLGLSLAGWNVLISLGLAGFAAALALAGGERSPGYGSSSVSQ